MLINKIVLWVHPDWHTHQTRTYFPTHKIQETLREEWAANILRLSNEPETLLVCFPSFSIASFGKMLHNNQKAKNLDRLKILNSLIERELTRKEFATHYLEDRYIEVENGDFPTEENFVQRIYASGFSLCEELSIECYGEYFHICVKDWGKKVAEILSKIGYCISLSYNEELSLGKEQSEIIELLCSDHQWRKSAEKTLIR